MDKLLDLLEEKILVIDGAPSDRARAADILARVGYSTFEVDSGLHALEVVQLDSPDLVLLNAEMPDIDGLELCRRLKSDPFTRHIPILVFARQDSTTAKVNTLRAGADSFIYKPYAPDELVAEVEALVRRSFQFDPLTKLPAAPYLHTQIDIRLRKNQPTAILCLDIDNFRAYNQAYGHHAGDRMLVETSKLIVDALPTQGALAGHLGGDEFLAVVPPEAAESFAETVVREFRKLQKEFYRDGDLARGAVLIQNRRGDTVEFPLATASVAICTNFQRSLTSYVQATEILAEVMGYVKSQGGDRWARDRRTH